MALKNKLAGYNSTTLYLRDSVTCTWKGGRRRISVSLLLKCLREYNYKNSSLNLVLLLMKNFPNIFSFIPILVLISIHYKHTSPFWVFLLCFLFVCSLGHFFYSVVPLPWNWTQSFLPVLELRPHCVAQAGLILSQSATSASQVGKIKACATVLSFGPSLKTALLNLSPFASLFPLDASGYIFVASIECTAPRLTVLRQWWCAAQDCWCHWKLTGSSSLHCAVHSWCSLSGRHCYWATENWGWERLTNLGWGAQSFSCKLVL